MMIVLSATNYHHCLSACIASNLSNFSKCANGKMTLSGRNLAKCATSRQKIQTDRNRWKCQRLYNSDDKSIEMWLAMLQEVRCACLQYSSSPTSERSISFLIGRIHKTLLSVKYSCPHVNQMALKFEVRPTLRVARPSQNRRNAETNHNSDFS